MPRLREAVEELARRRLKVAERAAEAVARKAAEEWAAKRAAANPNTLSAEELANMWDGLTPDGYDKAGRKVRSGGHGLPRRRGLSDGLRGFYR